MTSTITKIQSPRNSTRMCFLGNLFLFQHSDGEKSDQDLVVDDASEDPISPSNGTSPRENGIDKLSNKKDHPPHSPRSGTSSNASTPSTKKLDPEKPCTPISKPVTPTSGAPSSSSSSNSGLKPVVKPPSLGQYPSYLSGMANGRSTAFREVDDGGHCCSFDNLGSPHDLQAAAAAAAGAYGPLHNNLPPSLNNYPRPPLQVAYDPHSQMRAPVVAGLGGIPGGKP